MRKAMFFILLLYFAIFMFSPGLGSEGNKIQYIDSHNHIVGKFGFKKGPAKEDYDGAARVALAKMDELGIKTMVIMPPPFTPGNPSIYDLKHLADICNKYPGRFAFFGGGEVLNPIIQEAVRKGYVSPELRNKFIKEANQILAIGAIGFGEFAVEHFCLGKKHNHQSAPADHPLFLLLSDIAAENNVPIDIHMEAVSSEMPIPQRLDNGKNPKVLSPNIPVFERLLEHNKKTKIIWSHAGWCNTGKRTAEFTADLLKKHSNLYMSFKISFKDSQDSNCPIEKGRGLLPIWLKVMREYPDRFIIGSDQFYLTPRMPGKIGPRSVEPTNRFFSLLPPELAYKIGYENPKTIFNLKD